MAFFNLTDSVQGDIGEVMAETHIRGEKADGLTVRYVLIDQHSQISAETSSARGTEPFCRFIPRNFGMEDETPRST